MNFASLSTIKLFTLKCNEPSQSFDICLQNMHPIGCQNHWTSFSLENETNDCTNVKLSLF